MRNDCQGVLKTRPESASAQFYFQTDGILLINVTINDRLYAIFAPLQKFLSKGILD